MNSGDKRQTRQQTEFVRGLMSGSKRPTRNLANFATDESLDEELSEIAYLESTFNFLNWAKHTPLEKLLEIPELEVFLSKDNPEANEFPMIDKELYPSKIIEINDDQQEMGLYSAVESDYAEPATYKKMMKLPEEERNKWIEGVNEELKNLEDRKVWVRKKLEEIPTGRKLIGTKWVFKRKRDGRYRSRLVALGYAQIPGVDFTDNFLPVVSDVTLRIVLTIWMICDLEIDQMDVETAFLEGLLEEPEYVYLKCPDGMTLEPDECLEVRRGLYGLVASARIFWRSFSRHLTSDTVGFEQSLADQCLFFKQGKYGPIFLLLYVDDSVCVGQRQDIEETIKLIQTRFTLTVEGKLNDFLGCSILRKENMPVCWLLQPHLIKKLEENFKQHIGKKKVQLTPGTPRMIIKRTKPEEPSRLSAEQQTLYQSGVGSLLYLLKHSRPELSNPIRELSKAMSGANKEALDEMYRVINWVLHTKNIGLCMAPKWKLNKEGKIIWKLRGICDSTWGSDPDDGRSVSGYVLYFMDVPISWKSKTQSHVTLSSAEAEYVSVSELVKEIMFVVQLLELMHIPVELPVKIFIDNVGAIYMARNNASGPGTRHVNYRYHYCREVHGSLIELIFVKSEENEADILTKNPTKKEQEKHVGKWVSKVPSELLK